MLTYSKWEISPPTVTSYPTLRHKREREREDRTREHEESERQRKVKDCVCEKDCESVWEDSMLDGGSVCRCVCACVSVLFGQIDFVVGQGVSGEKKNLLKVLLFPRDRCQIVTHTHTHIHTHTALYGRVPCCLHTLWLRCHLSQARCGWAGSCVCGCFALGLSSRIFIINEVTDYTFQISSCSMCWADVVSLSVFPLWYIFIDIYSTKQHTVYLA